MLRAGPHVLTPPDPSSPPRPHSDEELSAALAPFASDYVAHLQADQEADEPAAARMRSCGRLARYYALICLACEDAADAWRKGRAA